MELKMRGREMAGFESAASYGVLDMPGMNG